MTSLEEIITGLQSYYPAANVEPIRKAYRFSEQAHKGQMRVSGDPFFYHPAEVAKILVQMKLDVASIVTGLLHDTVEDTLATPEQVKKNFGQEIFELVDGVTKLSQMTFRSTQEQQAENFRKMILAMAKDIRVILVKLADRLHNMRTLEHLPPIKQMRIAQETMDIYAPIANRLGISWMKIELEDLALRHQKPEIYYKLGQQVAKKKKEREKYIEQVQEILRNKLKEHGLVGDVTGRPKHFYSIYKKMEERKMEFEQIYDVIAFRIIVKSLPDCYETLGMIHSIWKPVPGRFKDYIAIPKANSYQSLHTTVIGPHGERIEIQIRTEEMHKIAEEGIAAHWKYKEGKIDQEDEKKFIWLRQLLEWQKELKDPAEFLDTMRLDLFAGDVFVFTPKGEVIELPYGATPIDFAYAIHTGVGNRCMGAKVNGKIVPLKHHLKSGDAVEILTSDHQHPHKDWLAFVKTSKAKAKIRQYLKSQEREKGRELGWQICEKEFERHGLNFNRLFKDKELEKVAEGLNYKGVDDLLVAVGYGLVSPMTVLHKFIPPEQLKEQKEKSSVLQQIFKKVARRARARGAIQIEGYDDILVRFAKCCTPLPGDPVVGFITRGRGVSVHQTNCPKMLASDAERKVNVQWSTKPAATRHAKLRVVCVDEPGLLVEMSRVFTSHGVNISQAKISTTRDKKAINIFEVEIHDLYQLQKVMKAMEGIPGVISVERV